MRSPAIFAAVLGVSAIGALAVLGVTAGATGATVAPVAAGGLATATPAATPGPSDGFFFGDFNCDNNVSMDDAIIGLQALADPVDTTTGNVCAPNGDLDCDGDFDDLDVLAIARFVAELPLAFAGCPTVGALQFNISPECANLNEPAAIPDGGAAPLQFDFPESAEILGIGLCINVNHPRVGDLVITLKHEDTGTVVTLVDRVGNPANSGNCTGHGQGLFVVFADSGAESLQERCTNTATSEFVDDAFRPDEPLDAFAGEDVRGAWTLTVTDAQAGNTGSVLGALFTYVFQP